MTLAPSILFHIGSFPVTNTLVTTLVVDVIIIALVIVFNRCLSLYPKGIQNFLEMVYEYFYNSTKEISSKVDIISPWVITFFIFIVISNVLGQFPGFETIRFYAAGSGEEGVPLFRTATSDLNVTLAFATISIVMCHFYSIKYTGLKSYIGRFVSLSPIFLFVGLLEFIGEFTKVISLSCRLFGNLFAGESVMGTISSMSLKIFGISIPLPFFAVPVPFMMLELMVAVIQAIVFAMLTMTFMSIMVEKH
ncbi:MAG: F0F1 ATP synthase subunit A [Elusimicrobia bacterium]|nr:F0F1 ATP synthase subunit A [Elusimicrobiota bacterium]